MSFNDTSDQIISGGIDNEIKVHVLLTHCLEISHSYCLLVVSC